MGTDNKRERDFLARSLKVFSSTGEKPAVWMSDATNRVIDDIVPEWRNAGYRVVTLRGNKMRTFDRMYDELSAALQFPLYFGQNMAALSDLLTDLSWMPPGNGYVFVISNPGQIVADEDRGAEAGVVIETLAFAREYWTAPIVDGEVWDRPAIPFTLLLGVSDHPQGLRALWERFAGPVSFIATGSGPAIAR